MQEQLQAGLAQRYVLHGEVGRGAMATIYRVHDRKHNRAVAVKVLDPELAATMGPTRFLREITLAAGLQHPHILPVYDSGETAGFLWFTMPYVDGESLRDLLNREKRLTTGRALAIASEIAEALDYAHRRGVLHRDIKPDNIMLTEGHALVADFGVARPADLSMDAQITGPGLVVGTPAYMAPEQAMGDPIDARSDLYSLGIVIYEMLAGSLPMPDTTSELLEVKRISGERQTLPPLGPEIPSSVRKVVRKALAPTKDQRYQSGAEFSRALRSELVRTGHAGTLGPRSPRLYAIEVGLFLAALVVLLALLSGCRAADSRSGGLIPRLPREAAAHFGRWP
jgi:serine/threonine protein kinase